LIRVEIDKNKPHAFVEKDVPRMSMIAGDSGRGFVPSGRPVGPAAVCGLCRRPRADQIHLDGQASADVESPNWR
jgi:hypothetical protein